MFFLFQSHDLVIRHISETDKQMQFATDVFLYDSPLNKIEIRPGEQW